MTTNTSELFELVQPARWVEFRTIGATDNFGDSIPWVRTNISDVGAFEDSLGSVSRWEHPDNEIGPIGDGRRVVRFSRAVLGESGAVIELRTVSKYHGVYEQVEALRRHVIELEAEASNSDGDVGSEMIDRALIVRALDDILAHDRYERDALTIDGYCRHGVYVGGCGVDWMCGACEAGEE